MSAREKIANEIEKIIKDENLTNEEKYEKVINIINIEFCLKEELEEYLLSLRGVDFPCEKCRGTGTRLYGDTSTWRGGIGGCTVTLDICDECWGSGDKYRKFINLRKLYVRIKELEDECKRKD